MRSSRFAPGHVAMVHLAASVGSTSQVMLTDPLISNHEVL
jgi:hypothetical protein